MKKVQIRYISIFALLAMLVLVLAFAVHAVLPSRQAMADTYAPSTVFSAGSGGSVGASEETDGDSYVQFSLSDGGKVHYRRDLALRWFEQAEESTAAGNAIANPGVEKFFHLALNFPAVHFATFKISFESAEENISKEGKATNFLEFVKQGDNVEIFVRNASYNEEENAGDAAAKTIALSQFVGQDLTLSFAAAEEIGNFDVQLQVGEGTADKLGTFTNIGGNFLEYRSIASSTPNTPVTFESALAEGTEETAQLVLVKSLNGQSMKLENGLVNDTAVPVLVLNERIYGFRLGARFSLSYEVIDVCDDSVSPTRSYYLAKKAETEGEYIAPDTGSDDDYKSLTTSTYFMPTAEGDGLTEYVSIRFRLRDDSENETYVYLTWYAAGEDAVKTFPSPADPDSDGDGPASFDYIVVHREQKDPAYLGIEANETEKKNVISDDAQAAIEAYQRELEAAAEKASAGNGSYLYLPSLRGLIGSESVDYRNLDFTVCYKAGSNTSSETSLDYNNLRIELTEEGDYSFRIFATDPSGNGIMLYDEDGDLVEVTTNNIWDLEGVPQFDLRKSEGTGIVYKGVTIEDMEEQSVGYRDSVYDIEDFEIISLGHDVEYTLYWFDSSKVESLPRYSDFVANAKEYTETTYLEARVEIQKFNDAYTEDDSGWDRTDNDYAWDPDSSLSFNPQVAGIYVVKADIVWDDTMNLDPEVTAYQVIEVNNPIDRPPTNSYWLENNITSVVLFAISGVLAIVIVILFVVKPSEKKVEEVDLEQLKGRKKNNK